MLSNLDLERLATPCFVVHPSVTRKFSTRDPKAALSETIGLAEAIDLRIVHKEIINVKKPNPAVFLGRGVIDRLSILITDCTDTDGFDAIVVMDCILSPIQQRNLEQSLNCKVIDRTGLILEIFGARARTKEGRLQVNLAALTYQRSRLVRSWTHLERQRGGAGFMGGPGERQIELDRRLIDQQINRINRELKNVRRTRELHRRARKKVPYPVVALVGYTNAGKSTLFNYLTNSDVVAKDQLFATLDPTMRAMKLPDGHKVVLSDTVGFISALPHELVDAFHATLEEIIEADLIVHVRDISHPNSILHKADVKKVLNEIGIKDSVQNTAIEVLNKIDLLDTDSYRATRARSNRANTDMITVSAFTGEGCKELLELLATRLALEFKILKLKIDPTDGRRLAWLYEKGEVINRRDTKTGISLTVRLSPVDAARLEQWF